MCRVGASEASRVGLARGLLLVYTVDLVTLLVFFLFACVHTHTHIAVLFCVSFVLLIVLFCGDGMVNG